MLGALKRKIQSEIESYHDRNKALGQAKVEKGRLMRVLKDAEPLSKEEISAIKKKWGRIVKNIKPGFSYYRGLKYLDRFDENYLSLAYYWPYIERILNPPKYKFNLGHKGMLEMIYRNAIAHPVTLFRSYGGILLNKDYHPIPKEEAIEIIRSEQRPLLYKPAVESAQGAGIRKFDVPELEELCNIIEGIGMNSPVDFVIQELVSQSPETKIFNPSSLNCMRVTTLNLNGKISVCSRAIKCGPKDSVVDNIGNGRRGVIVGINSDGTLCDRGFYGNGDVAEGINGLKFKDCKIDHFGLVEEAAVRLHQIVPSCKIIGWDIALDENNTPVLIEGNTHFPGISLEQMCTGPIFGDRTDEVIEYVKSVLVKDKKKDH